MSLLLNFLTNMVLFVSVLIDQRVDNRELIKLCAKKLNHDDLVVLLPGPAEGWNRS